MNPNCLGPGDQREAAHRAAGIIACGSPVGRTGSIDPSEKATASFTESSNEGESAFKSTT